MEKKRVFRKLKLLNCLKKCITYHGTYMGRGLNSVVQSYVPVHFEVFVTSHPLTPRDNLTSHSLNPSGTGERIVKVNVKSHGLR